MIAATLSIMKLSASVAALVAVMICTHMASAHAAQPTKKKAGNPLDAPIADFQAENISLENLIYELAKSVRINAILLDVNSGSIDERTILPKVHLAHCSFRDALNQIVRQADYTSWSAQITNGAGPRRETLVDLEFVPPWP